MKNKSILILLAVVIGLGLYAYFGEYKRTDSEDQKKSIVTFNKDQIQKIEILTTSQKLTMTRTTDGWNLSGSIDDQADNEIVESLLDQVMMEKSVDQISITPAVDLQQYGLNPSLGSISFEDNLGNRQTVEVSAIKNFEGLYFLRKDKQDQILTSGDSWFSFMTKPSEGFRNLRLFRSQISNVNEIKITNKVSKIHLKNYQGQWQLVGNEKMQLDQNSIREILTQVSASKGIQSMSSRPFSQKIMSLELTTDKFNFKSDFYTDPKSKDLLVSINEPIMNIRFGPQVMEKLRDLKVSDLRDKTLPFQFDVSQVEKIEFKTKLKSQQLLKSDGQWNSDPKKIEEFLKKLNGLKVYQYFEKPVSPRSFTYEIFLYNQAGKMIFQLQWSDIQEHEAYAKTSLSHEIFLLDDAQIIRLETQKLIENRPEQKESSKL